MRWAGIGLCLLMFLGCGTEAGAPTDPAPFDPAEPVPAPTVERSPDEDEPFEAPSAIEQSTGFVAALHQQALRESDPGRAAQMLERACDDGFVPSCLAFADRLEAGEGVDPNPERAAELVEQACAEGSTLACDRMGH